MYDARQEILYRINDIRVDQQDFRGAQWKNCINNGNHVSIVQFDQLSDHELVKFFETIIFVYYKQR